MTTPTQKQILEASIASQQEQLERLQRDEAMAGRVKFAEGQLATVRNIITTQQKAVVQLEHQVAEHFDALVSAVESGHAQVGHFFQLTSAGERSSEAAALALKNVIALRFNAKVQLAAGETRLREQEAIFA